MNLPSYLLFGGTANPALNAAVDWLLRCGISPSVVERFPDGEISVRLEQCVRGHSVFLIQPTSPPVTDHLFQLLEFVDACRRAAAARVTAIVPYFGYARADKRHARRESITASMVAALLQAVGLDHLVTIDLHAPQIEGFFHLPVDNLTAVPTLCEALKQDLPPGIVVVSPDEGRVKMANEYAQRLSAPLAVLHKQRVSGTEAKIIHVAGDVRDRPCLIVDDMISTGETMAKAMTALLSSGAYPSIWMAATHGLLVGNARARLSHPALQEIFITDTIATDPRDWPELRIVHVAPLIAEAIQRLSEHESIGELFHEPSSTSPLSREVAI